MGIGLVYMSIGSSIWEEINQLLLYIQLIFHNTLYIHHANISLITYRHILFTNTSHNTHSHAHKKHFAPFLWYDFYIYSFVSYMIVIKLICILYDWKFGCKSHWTSNVVWRDNLPPPLDINYELHSVWAYFLPACWSTFGYPSLSRSDI